MGSLPYFRSWQRCRGSRGEETPVQRLTPTTDNQWARAFLGRRRGLHAETAQAALTVILKLVVSDLTSVILVILSIINLQSWSWFVPISLRTVLRIVADCHEHSLVVTY